MRLSPNLLVRNRTIKSHAVGNKVEQAYRRGTGFKKRVALADAWASYVGKPRRTDGKVVTFKRA